MTRDKRANGAHVPLLVGPAHLPARLLSVTFKIVYDTRSATATGTSSRIESQIHTISRVDKTEEEILGIS